MGSPLTCCLADLHTDEFACQPEHCPLLHCSTTVEVAGRRYARTRYFLRADECPNNYREALAACRRGGSDAGSAASGAGTNCAAEPADGQQRGVQEVEAGRTAATGAVAVAEEEADDAAKPGLLPIGITTFTQLFSNAELAAIEEASGERGGRYAVVLPPWVAGLQRTALVPPALSLTATHSCLAPHPPDGVDAKSHAGLLPDTCYHRTVAHGGAVKRTKYFFGARSGGGACFLLWAWACARLWQPSPPPHPLMNSSLSPGQCDILLVMPLPSTTPRRYTWTREQLAAPDARVAGGVRVDVPTVPAWMRQQVEAPLVAAGVVDPGFVDSIALNMYHDGSEGIQVGLGVATGV